MTGSHKSRDQYQLRQYDTGLVGTLLDTQPLSGLATLVFH